MAEIQEGSKVARAQVDVMELAERVIRDNGPLDRSDEGALAHALLQTAQDKAYYLQRSDRLGAAETQMRAAVLWLERRTRYEGSRREDCVQYAESHARAALHLAGFTTEAGNPLTPKSPVSESRSGVVCRPTEGET